MGPKEDAKKLADRGLNHFRKRQFKKAADLFVKACDLEPDNQNLWSLLAQSQANLGEYESALESISIALAIEDKSFLNWQLKGTFLTRQNRLEEARDAIDMSLKLNKSSTSYVLRGQVEYNLQNYEEALNFFNEALKSDPEHPLANQMKGLVLFIHGSYGEAIPFMEKALEVGGSESLEKILDECRKKAEPPE